MIRILLCDFSAPCAEVLDGALVSFMLEQPPGCDQIGTRRSLLQARPLEQGSPWNERKDTNAPLILFACGQWPALGSEGYEIF